jgi:O-antigen ligase
MFASIASLVLLGLSLAWTALNKSGIPAFDWYISLILIGLAFLAFWLRPRRMVCPPLPRWLIWTIRGILFYLLFQAIPLPLSLLDFFSPERAALTRSLSPILGAISAAPISVDPAAHILWFLTIAGCAAAFFLVRDLTFRLRNRVFFALLPLFAVAAFEALLGLLQIAGGAEQAIGSYNSRDHYCCLLEITLPLAIAFGLVFFGRKNTQASLWPVLRAIGCWFVATILVLGILFSLSRAGWIDSIASLLLLSILLLFPKAKSATWRFGILGGLVVVVVALFLVASPEAMLNRLVGTLTPDSKGRLYIWSQLMPLTREFRWFGTGLMGFDPVFLKYQDFVNAKRVDFAHNDFLQYLIEMGIWGFVPLLISLGAIVWPVVRSAWSAGNSSPTFAEIRVLLAGCTAGLFALFLHSLVDFNLYVPANVFAFAWILGFGSALTAILADKMKSPSPESDLVQ